MKLIPIPVHPDRSDQRFQHPDCQQILDTYTDYYPIIGFNPPWIGYFIVRDDVVVGYCGFLGQPVGGQVEITYATFAPYEKQDIASFVCEALLAMTQQADPSLVVTGKPAQSLN
jgi:RimJ/RimL family protein N-acetyltransferase